MKWRSFKSAIERQITEAVAISIEEGKGTTLMNSKAEYNRCKLPRLNTQSIEDQAKEIERIKEDEIKLKKEIRLMKKRDRKKVRKEELDIERKEESDLLEVCETLIRDGEKNGKEEE